jgi:hypothetical protein
MMAGQDGGATVSAAHCQQLAAMAISGKPPGTMMRTQQLVLLCAALPGGAGDRQLALAQDALEQAVASQSVRILSHTAHLDLPSADSRSLGTPRCAPAP